MSLVWMRIRKGIDVFESANTKIVVDAVALYKLRPINNTENMALYLRKAHCLG
jgi:hypothetical protein